QDYPDVESRVIVHKAGLRQLELPVRMRARMAGVSSINSWKSIYYAFKVSLAMITSALKDINLQKQSPYINDHLNGGYRTGSLHDSRSAQHTQQNVHSLSSGEADSTGGPTAFHGGAAPNGAESIQPSGVESQASKMVA